MNENSLFYGRASVNLEHIKSKGKGYGRSSVNLEHIKNKGKFTDARP